MQFSKFFLDNYLQTSEGKDALNFFERLPRLIRTADSTREAQNFINNLSLFPNFEYWFNLEPTIAQTNYKNFEEFAKDIHGTFQEWIFKKNIDYRDIVESIPNLSLILYAESQQYSFPYFYPGHFFKIQEICDFFDILLPPLPGRTKYEEKCLYYIKLCKVFYIFRRKHQLSPAEFCVFFYSFAPHFIEDPRKEALPKPLKSYIVGANPSHDHSWLQALTSDSIHFWQGNSETERGDIILMYELAPYSHISSVWRAITPGYDDPFRYYPGEIWIGNPIEIPPVTLDELKVDPIWSEKGLVKANMQGVAGRPCSYEEWQALLAILRRKKFDISLLPSLEREPEGAELALSCERDVETRLLEPFLKTLGLAEKDWMRQMPLRMGRKNCYYPDYAIHAQPMAGDEKAKIVCEAKFRIPSKIQLKKDFDQAKSYARRLGSGGLILASCEGLWLSLEADDFALEKARFHTWLDLGHPDAFHSIKSQVEALLRKKRR